MDSSASRQAGREALDPKQQKPAGLPEQPGDPQTKGHLDAFLKGLQNNQGTVLRDVLVKNVGILADDAEVQKRFTDFWGRLTPKQQTDSLTALADTRDETLLGKMRSLMEKVGGAEAVARLHAGAQKVLGFIDQMLSRVDLNQIAPILAKVGLKPESLGGMKGLFVGMAAKLIEGLAKSFKGLGGPIAQVYGVTEGLRAAQLHMQKLPKQQIDFIMNAYRSWSELEEPKGPPPTNAKEAERVMKLVASRSGTPEAPVVAPENAPAAPPQGTGEQILARKTVILSNNYSLDFERTQENKTLVIRGQDKFAFKVNRASPSNAILRRAEGSPTMLELTVENKTIQVDPEAIRRAIAENKQTVKSKDNSVDITLEKVATTV